MEYGKNITGKESYKIGKAMKKLKEDGTTIVQLAIQYHCSYKTVKSRIRYYEDNTYRKVNKDEKKPYFTFPVRNPSFE